MKGDSGWQDELSINNCICVCGTFIHKINSRDITHLTVTVWCIVVRLIICSMIYVLNMLACDVFF